MNILLCDDDSDLIEFIEVVLTTSFNYVQLTKTTHPDVAKQVISNNDFDLVICDFDFKIPGRDGMSVYEALRVNPNDSRFILYTSCSEILLYDYLRSTDLVYIPKHKFELLLAFIGTALLGIKNLNVNPLRQSF